MPPLVYAYHRSKVGGFILFYALIAINMIVNVLIAAKYDLKAGPLAVENYYMFSYMMYKPYSKLAQMCIGIQVGILYDQILRYRKAELEEKIAFFGTLHRLHKSRWVSPMLVLTGLGLILTCLFSGYEALKDPYSWPPWKNYLYFALIRPAYVIGCMLLFTAMVTGHFNSGMRCLRNTYFRALGKISFESALVSPMVITLAYQGQEYPMYLTIPGGIAFGMGNIISILSVSILIYLFLEYPIKRLVYLATHRKQNAKLDLI